VLVAGTSPEGAAGSRWEDPLFPGLQNDAFPGKGSHWCDACGVRWSGTPDCWICGAPGQSYAFLLVKR
jgi:rubrerythrin